MQKTQASDAAIFGEVGGENYFLPLSNHRNELLCTVRRAYSSLTEAEIEYAMIFLQMPPAGLWMSQYETLEYLWLGEVAA